MLYLMSNYLLTNKQTKFIKQIVHHIRQGDLEEEFEILVGYARTLIFSGKKGIDPDEENIEFSWGIAEALCAAKLLIPSSKNHNNSTKEFTVTQKAYDAVDANFDEPDTSFIKYITPLADVSNLDNELKTRCLRMLGAGSSDSTLWDSAVRTAGVILEERLRQKGNISDRNITGQGLVNKIFSKTGILANKFTVDSERQGYRDLYAGIIGTYRNPSAHRLIDPTPEEGGTFIMFVDLLLKKLDNL